MTADSSVLAEHLLAARAAWPTLVWDEREYIDWLVVQTRGDLGARLARATPGDAILCWCVGRGDAEAVRLFEVHVIPQVARALARYAPTPAFVDEVEQAVRIKLLVARDGGGAPLWRFALTGKLTALVRMVAVREALTLQRSEHPNEPVDFDNVVGLEDPELRIIKQRYAREFEQALAAAIAQLSSRDRRVLRLSMSARASIDDIARIFQTHRATAARWLHVARDALAATMHRKLRERLQLRPDELASLMRLIRTEAERYLESIPPESDE